MRSGKMRDKSWYPYTVAACAAVLLYVVLTHLTEIVGAVRTFGGFFASLALGCVLAYLMNPLAMRYQRSVFKGVRRDKLRWALSVGLALLTVLLVLALLLGTLIPQLVDSIGTLLGNMDGYLASLQALAEQLGIAEKLNLNQLLSSTDNVISKVMDYLSDNLKNILSASAAVGKNLMNWVIALILSVYLLSSKDSLKAGVSRLLRALMPRKRYDGFVTFFSRCDKILIRYIVYSLLDAAIVGMANAAFMMIFGMQYIGLVSMVVAVTNLIPTFGPVIGAVIGGFVLLLVNPMHALAFLIFTLVLQFLDGYVIKPKLFGDSLGVSGLLILVSVVVCGNMFGIVGILLSIPLAAILDFIYRDYLLPALEARQANRDKA